MLSNPYESPRSIVSRPTPSSRSKLLPTLLEMAFLAILAVTSTMVHETHRDIFNWLLKMGIGGGTVLVLVGVSTVLSFVGCGITSICKRTNSLMSITAFLAGIVSATIVSLFICWHLLSTSQAPSGLIVFVSVVAGMVATTLVLVLPSELRAKPVGTLTEICG